MKLIVSVGNKPEENLNLEYKLLTERPQDVLLLYRNMPSVIVGRNQCIEAEVDLGFCQKEGIPVIKRISGGGTVYHDLGNINYAFITGTESGRGTVEGVGNETVLDWDATEPIVWALRSLGIEAVTGPRKELNVNGYKVSGSASHISKGRQLFHGTLLHRTDLTMLDRVLRGDASKRGRKVASVPGRVANIAQLTESSESTEAFMERLSQALQNYYNR